MHCSKSSFLAAFPLLFLCGYIGTTSFSPVGHTNSLSVHIIGDGETEPLWTSEITLTQEMTRLELPKSLHLPYATLRGINIKRPDKSNHPLTLTGTFTFEGAIDSNRQVLVDVLATDRQGETVFHTWHIHEDGRMRPDYVQGGTLRLWQSKENTVQVDLLSGLGQIKTLRITFRQVYRRDLRHLPARPQELKLSITEPDDKGLFHVAFCNPDGLQIDGAQHGIVLVLRIRDITGKEIDKVVKTYDAQPLAEGHKYQCPLHIDPKYFDYSSLSVTFYTKQPDNKTFLQNFFVEGKGSAYSGIWFSDAGDLWRIPPERFYEHEDVLTTVRSLFDEPAAGSPQGSR